MRLKKDADVVSFLNAARHCENDVYFCTINGDRLDLKSELTGYVFIAQARNHDFLYQSQVEVTGTEDIRRLGDYVTA